MRERPNHAPTPSMTRIAPETVSTERILPGSPERLWAHLVDADKRRLWFSGGDSIAAAGDRVLLVFNHATFADEPTPERYAKMDDDGISFTVEVTAFEPPHRLAFTWPEDGHVSGVEFRLRPHPEGVTLTVTHSRLHDTAQMANVASGWHAHLDVLDDLLRDRPHKGFWTNVLRLEQDYLREFTA